MTNFPDVISSENGELNRTSRKRLQLLDKMFLTQDGKVFEV